MRQGLGRFEIVEVCPRWLRYACGVNGCYGGYKVGKVCQKNAQSV
jgi:hypothetical protein